MKKFFLTNLVLLASFVLLFAQGNTSKIDSVLAPNQFLVGLLKPDIDILKKYQHQNQWKELAGELFDHPTAASVIEAVKRKHPNQSHPRILANASDFESLRLKIKNNPTYARWYKSVEEDACLVKSLK